MQTGGVLTFPRFPMQSQPQLLVLAQGKNIGLAETELLILIFFFFPAGVGSLPPCASGHQDFTEPQNG